MNQPARTETFLARIYKIGLLRCVDLPRDVSIALGSGNRIAVRGSAEGLPFVSTLVPRGKGRHKLYVHGKIWRKLRRDAGDEIEITIERDFDSRELAMPADLMATLARTPRALATFQTRTVALRREIAMWVSAAKKPETCDRRIGLVVRRMLDSAPKQRKTTRARIKVSSRRRA